jgi:hypothetical protein
MDRSVGLSDVEKRKFFILPGLGRPAPVQSLYQPRYSGSPFCRVKKKVMQVLVGLIDLKKLYQVLNGKITGEADSAKEDAASKYPDV